MAFRPLNWLLDGLTSSKAAALCTVAALGAVAFMEFTPSQPVRAQATAVDKPVAATGSFSADQVQSIRDIVRQYLIENPEIMVEVSKELEKKQQAQQAVEHRKVIAENKPALFKGRNDAVLGNSNGDVTVIEFFDYNCGWCKRAVDDVANLVKADAKVRVVMKEFPIFGDASSLAAKAALAAVRQGKDKYWDYHFAMMREKQVTKDNVFTIAQKVGLNVAKLKTDMNDPEIDKTLAETHQLAQLLSIEGTPAFVVDNRVNVGYVTVAALQSMLAEIRKEGCQVC
jgi:protein-disulfide isomerase